MERVIYQLFVFIDWRPDVEPFEHVLDDWIVKRQNLWKQIGRDGELVHGHAPIHGTREMEVFETVLDATPKQIQAIRRACFELVPTMAIQICEVRRNESLLKPEILMQRLSCVPICVDADSFVYKEQCACDSFCSRCSIRGTIKQTGGVVQSDLIPGAVSKIPIVVLGETQTIDFDWVALKGTGRQSAIHFPVTVVRAHQIAPGRQFIQIESIHYPAAVVFRKALACLADYCETVGNAV